MLPCTPIKHQFKATCWAFGPIATIETLLLCRGIRLPQSNLPIVFSEQQLVDCLGVMKTPNRVGGKSEESFDYASTNPLFLLSEYPYHTANLGNCQSPSNRLPVLSTHVKIEPRFSIHEFEQQLFTLLSRQTPVLINVNHSNMPSFRHLSASSAHIQSTDDANSDGNLNQVHAVCVIGARNGYWVIKNSWGPSWGDEGFFYIRFSSNAMNMCNHPAIYPVLNREFKLLR